MTASFRVKNWRQWQHYKDRNPPWIKLHWALLSSRDWVTLDDASRVLAIACMLVASRNEGLVPTDPTYIKRVAYLNRTPNFKPLIECGFLEPASTMLANARPETNGARPETETETEKEERRSARKGSRLPPAWQPSGALKAWALKERADLDLGSTVEKFVDHWSALPGSRGSKLDWDATFRNWVRTERAVKRDGTVAVTPSPMLTKMCAYCGNPASGGMTRGIWHCHEHFDDAMAQKPRPKVAA